MSIELRRARPQDRQQLLEVEKSSTPGLIYLPHVFDQFLADPDGEFLVAHDGEELVACGKFSVLPDHTAWLETLRVASRMQGMGIGKLFYRRFFEIAETKKISTMRMYTGISNHASKGLAEKFGFSLASTYQGFRFSCSMEDQPVTHSPFVQVQNIDLAAQFIRSPHKEWGDFLVMNRTFFQFNQALTGHLIQEGMIYLNQKTRSLIVIGARFMPEQALHIGFMTGDLAQCLSFCRKHSAKVGTASIHCNVPAIHENIQLHLIREKFQPEPAPIIVMEVHL